MSGNFLPNPRPANLVAVANAVEINIERLFHILGRDFPVGFEKFAGGGFTVRFNQLKSRNR